MLITFDDGYESFYTLAYPILKELNYKATVCLDPEPVTHGLLIRKGKREKEYVEFLTKDTLHIREILGESMSLMSPGMVAKRRSGRCRISSSHSESSTLVPASSGQA